MASRLVNIVSKVARGGAFRSVAAARAPFAPRVVPNIASRVIGARAFGSAEVSGNSLHGC